MKNTTSLLLASITILLGLSASANAKIPTCPATTQVSGFYVPAPWIDPENENAGFVVNQPKQDIWLDKGKEYYRCVYTNTLSHARQDEMLNIYRQMPVNLSTMEKLQYIKNTQCPIDKIRINVGLNAPSPWLKSHFIYSLASKNGLITEKKLTDKQRLYAESNNINIYPHNPDNVIYCIYKWGYAHGTSVEKLSITRPIRTGLSHGTFRANPTGLPQNTLRATNSMPSLPNTPAGNRNNTNRTSTLINTQMAEQTRYGKKTIQRFQNPKVKNMPLNSCRELGKNCGKPAATTYCKSKGYSRLISFKKSRKKSLSRTIGDSKICRAPSCYIINEVVCKR